jgi:glycosyltransferase involved in cell wall biosynthesis
MFGTTYYGCRVCPDKSVLIPCLHDESYAYMSRFKELFPKLRGMIFHSQPEYELADSIYDLSKMGTSVLGEGIDTGITGDAERFRKKYGINEEFILYAGRKDVGKNVNTLIDYFSLYNAHNPGRLKLILIGGGEIGVPLQAKNDIIDLGFLPVQDKYDAYAAALLLCQPSLNESFSIVIMESWLCGRPVLVHDKCAVTKDFAIRSDGGLYFSDYWEFTGCLEYLLSNPDTADKMGSFGREFVLENFNWDVVASKYIDFFKQLCI